MNPTTADSDADGDMLTVTDCGTVSHGTVAVNGTADGCIYTPVA